MAGCQKECQISEHEMHDKPFEAIKQLSSNRGRLIIIKNSDRIIRHPNFEYNQFLKTFME